MMVLINAFKSISRSKGRNILIGIIVFTVAVASCIALAIKSAAKDAENSGLAAKTITASISLDREKLMESAQQNSSGDSTDRESSMNGMREMMQKYQNLSLEDMQKYTDSEYLKEFYYSSSLSLSASGELEPYSEETDTSTSSSTNGGSNRPEGGGQQGGMGGNMGGGMMGGFSMGDFTLTGYSSENAMSRFLNGTSKISDGEMFDISAADSNIIISNELALFNGLAKGDKITLVNPSNEEETYEFTISGIFTNSDTSESEGMMRFSTSMDPANQIYMSYATLKSIADKSAAAATTVTDDAGRESSTALTSQVSGTYVFADKANYESFSKELTAKGLSEYYTLTSSDITNYEASLAPIKNLSSFATTLLIIILLVGGIILMVLNVFNIRERKYEVGVLTAIGIKKQKVALQFVTELLAVTFVAIILGAGVGAVASVPVSNSLLASQISAEESTLENQEQNFGRGGGMGMQQQQPGRGGRQGFGDPTAIFGQAANATEYLNTLNATINLTILGQLIGIGLILTIMSSLVGVVFVLRYEPLKILANRA